MKTSREPWSALGHAALNRLDTTGQRAVEELHDQARAVIEAEEIEVSVYPHQIAFNALPHVDAFLDSGYTKEEMKMENEGRKIMHHPKFRASVTCVRVPVYVGHAVSANVKFHRSMSKAEAVDLLRDAPGVRMVDDGDDFPTPLDAAGIDPVLVGRIRDDGSEPGSINLWVTGDNLRKGAALNGVQMAEILLADG